MLPYCSLYLDSVLPPLLEHTSFSEAHFHPLTQSRKLLLHTHTSAPFTSSPYARGVNLTLYSSPDCQVASLRLQIDWWGTLGHAGVRYWSAVPGWAVGIVMWLMFTAMGINERGGRSSRYHSLLPAMLTYIAKLPFRACLRHSPCSYGRACPDSWAFHLSYHSFHYLQITSSGMEARSFLRC